MTKQLENTEPNISEDELSDKDLAKVTGGDKSNTTKSPSSTPVESLSLSFAKPTITYTEQ